MDMDFTNSFSSSPNFTDLLNSQQEIIYPQTFSQTQSPSDQTPSTDHRVSKQRWSAPEEKVLVNAWLNTSKDAIVGNEQRGEAYASSRTVANLPKREANVCKQKWGKMSEGISKFAGCYEYAKRNKKSGQNEEDLMEVAYQVYFSDNKVKFTLEHVWRLLRNDQKWCTFITEKTQTSSKRSKLNELFGVPSSSNPACQVEEETEERPLGVKASKLKEKKRCKGKSAKTEGSLKVLQDMWVIKEKDNIVKQRLSDQKILDSLLAKFEPLSQIEVELKTKLMTAMCKVLGEDLTEEEE